MSLFPLRHTPWFFFFFKHIVNSTNRRNRNKRAAMAKSGIQAEEPVFTFNLKDFLHNKELVENELVLTTEGRGVNRTSHTNVEEIIRKTANISKEENIEEQFSCYRLEVLNRWYIRCNKEELVEKLMKKSELVTRVRLLWVPPNM